jgi:hypothetical protein
MLEMNRLIRISAACLVSLSATSMLQASASSIDEYSDYINLERAEPDYHAAAQTVESEDAGKESLPQLPKEKIEVPFSGTLAYNAFSQYNSYGLVIQPQGISSQPFLSLRYRAFKSEDKDAWLNSATLFLTTWSDFSSNQNLSNPSSSYRNFTETDIIIGTSLVLYQKINATFQLVSYVSPAGAYGFGSWARGTLVYDDSKPSSDFSLKPQVSLVYTFPAASSISLQPSSFLVEPGISPNWNILLASKYQANLSFPVRLGLGNKFYNGSTFGFTSIGPQLSVRLPQLSGKTFSTNLNAGYLYYYIGPTAAEFAANGKRSQNVFNLGISVNF